MCRSMLVLVVLVGCGDDSSGKPIDAPVDMPVDVLLDAPEPPVGHHHYVLDSILVPANNTTAREYGQDLSGDQVVDNQLGMVIGTLSSMGIDVQASLTANVDRGATITLADLFATNLASEPAATFALFVGTSPMPAACAGASDSTCRHHLAGTGSFAVMPGAPTNPPLTGALPGGAFAGTPGHIAVPFAMFPNSPPVAVQLIGAKVQLMQVGDPKIMLAKIAGVLVQSELDTKVYPAMAAGLQATVTKDCSMLSSPPGCGCPGGSTGKTEVDLFDTNHNCQISTDEVKNNSLIMSLFAPDVTVESMPGVSYGFEVTAVHAGFAMP